MTGKLSPVTDCSFHGGLMLNDLAIGRDPFARKHSEYIASSELECRDELLFLAAERSALDRQQLLEAAQGRRCLEFASRFQPTAQGYSDQDRGGDFKIDMAASGPERPYRIDQRGSDADA
jgi:hypothetical protein